MKHFLLAFPVPQLCFGRRTNNQRLVSFIVSFINQSDKELVLTLVSKEILKMALQVLLLIDLIDVLRGDPLQAV